MFRLKTFIMFYFFFQMMRNGCLTLCHFSIPSDVVSCFSGVIYFFAPCLKSMTLDFYDDFNVNCYIIQLTVFHRIKLHLIIILMDSSDSMLRS